MTSSVSSPYRVIEGQTAVLGCTVTDANPYTSILWKWFRTDSVTDLLYNGSRFVIHKIQRDRSGSYSCTASNFIGTSEAANAYLDVQCKYFLLFYVYNRICLMNICPVYKKF